MPLLNNHKKPTLKRYISIILAFLFVFSVNAQVEIGGDALNSYAKVTGVADNSVTCSEAVDAAFLASLSPGDKVLLIQMTGGYFDSPLDPDGLNDIDVGLGGVGKYEFLSVLSVNVGADEIFFTADLKNGPAEDNKYDVAEKIQLVKIFEAPSAIVVSEVTAPAWDGNRGGVLALVVMGKLTLQANIDLSAKGYRGGSILDYSLDDCLPSGDASTYYFTDGSLNKGGVKGEGGLSEAYNMSVGPGYYFLGGGGGYGWFGGGAGGGHYSFGGFGGGEVQLCGSSGSAEGGGVDFSTISLAYKTQNRVYMGGGGGSSVDSDFYYTFDGGRGGGIVFILADTLEAAGDSVIVDGESIELTSAAGGAGGGAGGAFLLDVEEVVGTLNATLNGGDGGSVSGSGTDCSGPGGGGSAGVFFHNEGAVSGVTITATGGDPGTAACVGVAAGVGAPGPLSLANLELVLNGFSFNAVSSNDTICYNQQPRLLIGTTPKGDNPQYKWLQSVDGASWSVISGETGRDYQPPVLTSTTYYTREVYLPAPADFYDTAMPVKVTVYPLIFDNDLLLRDTLCAGSVPGVLNAKPVSGGDGNYRYYWQSSEDEISWTSKGTITSDNLDETEALTETTYYRRIVRSGAMDVCTDTSAVDILTILDQIGGNTIANAPTDTIICNSLNGGTILGSAVTGGDAGYRYSWLRKVNEGSYVPINSNTKHYSAGNLATNTYSYKRIVYSGEGNACIDTTAIPRVIEVLPTITNNIITSDSLRYCYADEVKELVQDPNNDLGGGDDTFTYQWQQQIGAVWTDVVDEVNEEYFPGVLLETSTYRRIVSSGLVEGDLYACVDNGTPLTIDVMPEIFNSLVSVDETICQDIMPEAFAESAATGGAGGFTYQWEEKTISADWSNADNVSTQVFYAAPVLYQSTMYRRVAVSQICKHYSDTIEIIVNDSIEGNFVIGGNSQYACFNTPKALEGNSVAGGTGEYFYNWQYSDDAAVWADAGGTDNNFTTPELLTPMYFRRIVNSPEIPVCRDTSAAVYLDINDLPEGDILSGLDTICEGEEVTVAYENLSGNGPWTFSIGETASVYDELITDASQTGELVFPVTTTANLRVLSLIDDNGCAADTSQNAGRYFVKAYEIPEADAGGDSEACGLSKTLEATISAQDGTGIWTSNDVVTFSNIADPNAVVTSEDYGEVILTWTETTWGECYDETPVSVVFYEQPVEIDAGEDFVLNYELVTYLDAAEPVLPMHGYWKYIEGAGVFEDSTYAKTQVEMPEVGDYVLLWTLRNGTCREISDSLKIKINDLDPANGFSPNGDEVNDFYELRFPSGEPVTVTIYDRNGSRVWQMTGTDLISWDGKSEDGNVDVPEDTYFYFIQEGQKERSGFIELRR